MANRYLSRNDFFANPAFSISNQIFISISQQILITLRKQSLKSTNQNCDTIFSDAAVLIDTKDSAKTL